MMGRRMTNKEFLKWRDRQAKLRGIDIHAFLKRLRNIDEPMSYDYVERQFMIDCLRKTHWGDDDA